MASFTPETYGALGNGIANDTVAIQQAIDAAAVSGGRVLFNPGAVYRVVKTGTRPVVYAINPIATPYCLTLKSRVTLDLQGATLKIGNVENACILLNQGCLYSDPADTDIGILNGVLDGNRANQTTTGGVGIQAPLAIVNAQRVKLQGLRFDEVRDSAVRFMAVSRASVDDLYCSASDGDGFEWGMFGPTNAYDQRVFNSTFGRLVAENCLNGLFPLVGGGFRQGNPCVITAHDCTFQSLYAFSCGGGFKIQDGSERISVGQAIFRGATTPTAYNATDNSGVKVQGGSFVDYPPRDVQLGQVIVEGTAGFGLYIEQAVDVQVGEYNGVRNATLGLRPDVWIGASERVQIGRLKSRLSGAGAVLVRPGALDYRVNAISVLNAGQVASATGVQVTGGRGHLGTVQIEDNQTIATCVRGLHVPDPTTPVRVDDLDVRGVALSLSLASPLATVERLTEGSSFNSHGELSLAAGTQTLVATGAVWSQAEASAFVYPEIRLASKSAEAGALWGRCRVVPQASPLRGFIVHHPAALGGEKFDWQARSWALRPSVPG